MTIITLELLRELRKRFRLNWHGTHGVIHWHRVYENGVMLAEQAGVNEKIVQLFSVFHDSQRRNELWDRNHGPRGGQLALELRDFCGLNENELSLLTLACSLHTKARNHEDMTVKACFDSDRLDLGRVGTMPKAKYLCTPLAKQQTTIEWGYQRSLNRVLGECPFGLDAGDDVFSK